MYPVLHSLVESAAERDKKEAERTISKVTCGDALKNAYMKSMMTPEAMRIIKDTSPDYPIPELALRKMLARNARSVRKRMIEMMSKLDSASQSDLPEVITVSVEWTRGRYSEYNASATVRAGGYSTTGSAFGCGYDKESAAVAAAMNRNPAVLKVWYNHAENCGGFEYSIHRSESSPLPVMDGGCGMSATMDVFAALGYKMTESHGRKFDYYEFRKVD